MGMWEDPLVIHRQRIGVTRIVVPTSAEETP